MSLYSRLAHFVASSDIGGVYDVSVRASLFQDVEATIPALLNAPVGRMLDLSGQGHDLLQANAGYRPYLRGTANGAEILANGEFTTNASSWTLTPGAGVAQWNSGNGGQLALANGGTADQSFTTVPGKVYQLKVAAFGNAVSVQVGTSQGASDLLASEDVPAYTSPTWGSARYLWFTASGSTTWIRLSRAASGNGYASSVSVKAADDADCVAPYWLQGDGVDDLMQSAAIDLSGHSEISASAAYRIDRADRSGLITFIGAADISLGIDGLPTCLECGYAGLVINGPVGALAGVSQFDVGGQKTNQGYLAGPINLDNIVTAESNVDGAGQNSNPSNIALWQNTVNTGVTPMFNDAQSGDFGPDRHVSMFGILESGTPYPYLNGGMRYYGGFWRTRQTSAAERLQAYNELRAILGVPVTLIVEDGTQVEHANSYLTLAEADAYHAARGNSAWTGSDADKEHALVKATDYLQRIFRKRWPGSRALANQALDWPRGYVYVEGSLLDDDFIPTELKQAQAELALRALTGTDLLPDRARGGEIESVKVGEVSVTYAAGAQTTTSLDTILGVLEPLLLSSRGRVIRA